MNQGTALWAAAAVLAVALAGCSSGGGEGFAVDAPDAPGGEYVFTASGDADNYTWDLGDRLTVAYGKTVRHTYDFQNGNITVVLTTRSGDRTQDFRQALTLGTGRNAQPTFILEGQTNWTVVGEAIRFSAAKSTDPDGDPLRYQWSCVRTGEAQRQPAHSHPGFQGVPFASPPAGSVTAQNAVGPLPEPDRVVEGDLCEALGAGGRPGRAATIEGTFTRPGIYDLYLLASDPVHPTTSGKYHFVVTPPEERPGPAFTSSFFGNLTGGNNGSLQDLAEAGNVDGQFDRIRHAFSLPVIGTGGWAVTSYVGQDVPGGTLSWTLTRGTVVVATGGAEGNVTFEGPLPQATYALDVRVQGPGIDYRIDVGIPLDRDPFKYY